MINVVCKGQRYRARQAFRVTCMTAWAAPCTGGTEGLLPAGEVFSIANDPPPGATGVYADPEKYAELELLLVRQEDRNHPKYRGFYLSISLTDIEAHCELLP